MWIRIQASSGLQAGERMKIINVAAIRETEAR
jgi:hypothetical protein